MWLAEKAKTGDFVLTAGQHHPPSRGHYFREPGTLHLTFAEMVPADVVHQMDVRVSWARWAGQSAFPRDPRCAQHEPRVSPFRGPPSDLPDYVAS
jgi:hypothetical protein